FSMLFLFLSISFKYFRKADETYYKSGMTIGRRPYHAERRYYERELVISSLSSLRKRGPLRGREVSHGEHGEKKKEMNFTQRTQRGKWDFQY
ncbi:MAG: hypothetical protein AB1798_20200, partial [Spirochaetota bacterium]